MDLGALLCAVEFVHLEGRECGRFVVGQIEGFASRYNLRPIARTDVVATAGVKFACRREEAIDCPYVGTPLLPAEDKRLIEGISESTAAADCSLNVRGE